MFMPLLTWPDGTRSFTLSTGTAPHSLPSFCLILRRSQHIVLLAAKPPGIELGSGLADFAQHVLQPAALASIP